MSDHMAFRNYVYDEMEALQKATDEYFTSDLDESDEDEENTEKPL